MTTVEKQDSTWYFTAPWERVSIRRGDPLGFRAGADYFAELLAPGLSNATSDARWISLLCWCLQWSHIAWDNAGGRNLSAPDDLRARYAWLRPLELLWVDRTLTSERTTGQLRGRRSIERWRNADRLSPNFGMNSDQFRRYRQVGSYGAYRVTLRIKPLTIGDGWTLDTAGIALANLVNTSLPSNVKLKQAHFDGRTKWGVWGRGREAEYWVKHGWNTWLENPKNGLFPTQDDDIYKPLPETERALLGPILFERNSVRYATAIELSKAKKSWSHTDLCESLASSKNLSNRVGSENLAPFPAFTRFADTSMHAIRGLWDNVKYSYNNNLDAPTQQSLATLLKNRLDQVREEGYAWLNTSGRSTFPHDHVITELAKTIQAAKTPIDQLRALTNHHHEYGGGRRWFQGQSGKMIALVPDKGIAATDYRFRLRSLARLAAQCAIPNMNNALNILEEQLYDDSSEEDEK